MPDGSWAFWSNNRREIAIRTVFSRYLYSLLAFPVQNTFRKLGKTEWLFLLRPYSTFCLSTPMTRLWLNFCSQPVNQIHFWLFSLVRRVKSLVYSCAFIYLKIYRSFQRTLPDKPYFLEFWALVKNFFFIFGSCSLGKPCSSAHKIFWFAEL